MPKVIVTPNQSYNPTGVRLLLAEIGVGLMLQDQTTITCVMTDEQIARFRNSKGAAHKLEVVEDAHTPIPTVEANEREQEQSAGPGFPQTWGKAGDPRIIAHNMMDVAAAISAGYKRVSPDPLHAEVQSDDEPAAEDPSRDPGSTTPILDISAKKKK